MLKVYESIDEVRKGLLYQCECAIDDLLGDIRARDSDESDELEFKVMVSPGIAQQIREMYG